jgi:hypothetical protein
MFSPQNIDDKILCIMGKRRGNQSALQLSVSTRTRYRQSLPLDETTTSLLTFHPILLGGRDRCVRLRTLHRRNRRRQPSSRHPGDDSPGPSLAHPRGRGAQHDRTTTTVVEGRHVRARVHPAWRGGPLWGILLNHSHEVGQIVVEWVLETYRRRTPSSSSSSSLDDGGGDGGGGDIVLLGSSTAVPWS